ncbi:hypothetical protein Dimus_039235 [Dionaea muscipula]
METPHPWQVIQTTGEETILHLHTRTHHNALISNLLITSNESVEVPRNQPRLPTCEPRDIPPKLQSLSTNILPIDQGKNKDEPRHQAANPTVQELIRAVQELNLHSPFISQTPNATIYSMSIIIERTPARATRNSNKLKTRKFNSSF